jgi:hypothetical protein
MPPYFPYNSAPTTSTQKSREAAGSATTRMCVTATSAPEFSLGLTRERGGLDARRVAGILHDWVNGATLPEIANAWSTQEDRAEGLRQLERYLFRQLTGQIPWGLGALQGLYNDRNRRRGRIC